jgi:uncharacterized cupredoxin-like copper-binding protein
VIWLSVRRSVPLLILVALLVGCVKIGSAPSPTPGPGGSPVTGALSSREPGATAVAATPRPTPGPTATAAPSVSLPPAPTETPDDGTQVIEVELADSLTIDPKKMTVTAGTPVRFEVTNVGAVHHDFFIGSDKEQLQRESGTGEPGKSRFIQVPPGETVELTLTFDEAGKTIAGCTVAGHYSNGMKANITIVEP